MKFGSIPVEQAEHAILAHSIRLEDVRIAKGKQLDASDIARLDAAGFRAVVVARLEADDVHEDDAAARIAQSLDHSSLVVAKATTGRANIAAAAAGVGLVDAGAIHRMNAVHESMTIATIAPFAAVSTGQIVATVKIIPFAVARARLAAVIDSATSVPEILRVQPYSSRRVGVIFSELPEVPFKGRDKAERVLSARLAGLGGKIDHLVESRHEAAPLATAIANLVAEGADLVLMFGASAIVDRGDVIPDAIVRAGGEISYFGMPVDPGNMLLLGRLGAVDVVGLPGCARSPKFNGFDWVLQRLFARLALSGSDIAAMGVGGLLG